MKNQPQDAPLASMDADEILSTAAWLRSLARSLVRDSHDAEDLVQEAFGSVAAAGGEIRDLRAYLSGTVRHMAMKMHRGNLRRRDREALRAQDSPLASPPADHSLEVMDTMRVALEAVGSLPETQAKTIGLRYVEGLGVAEIAERMGSTQSTVRSNLARGLSALRERLDQRFGDRSTWCTVLLPIALTKEELAAHGAAQLHGSAGNSPSVPGVPAPTLPAAAGLAPAATILASVMTLKFAAITAVPALLALTYFQGQDGAAPVWKEDAPSLALPAQKTPLPTGPAGETAPGIAGLPEDDTQAARESVEAPSTKSAPGAVLASGAQDGLSLTFQTPEERPVEEIQVAFTPLDANGLEIPNTSGEERIATTGPDGRLSLDSLPEGARTVGLKPHVLHDHETYWTIFPATVELDHGEPLRVFMGPTFTFTFQGASVPVGTPMLLQATGPDITLEEDFLVPMLYGAKPLAHFGRWFSVENETGPWTLSARSHDGFLVGHAEVNYGRGNSGVPVPLTFTSTGCLQFETALSPFALGAESLTLPLIELTEVNEGAQRRVAMEACDQGLVASLGHLGAGAYAWIVPNQVDASGQPIAGEVHVIPGETLTVSVPPLGGPNLQQTGIIDATEAPGVDLAGWQCMSVDPNDLENRVVLQPTRAPDLGPDMWRVQLGGNPGPGWIYGIQAKSGFEVSPAFVTLEARGEIPTLRITTLAAQIEVTLTVVDAVTDQPIVDRYGLQAVHQDGPKMFQLKGGPAGLKPIKVSSTSTTSFVVGAPGYKKTEVIFEPGNTNPELRVELATGWRNRVRVVNMTDVELMSGATVTVDGVEVGVTDDAGTLWLERDGPPELIEVVAADESLELLISPYNRPKGQPTDTIDGYTFVFKKRDEEPSQ